MLEIFFEGNAEIPFFERDKDDGWYIRRVGEKVRTGPFVRVRDAETHARGMQHRWYDDSESIVQITQAGNRLLVA